MTDRPLRVLHLVGSAVDEQYAELSRLYASDCLPNTPDPQRYAPVIAHVEPGGAWRFPTGLDDASLAAAPTVDLPEAMTRLRDLTPDVAVPQMFCLPGMTTYRSLLSALGIPFVGNRAETMALGADKAKAKAVVAAAGVDVPAGVVVRRGETVDATVPVVVKPVDADNSEGLALVRDIADLEAAVSHALEHSDAALVEQYIPPGREVRCGVLERDGGLTRLPLEEYPVDPVSKPVRDEADKLRRDDGALTLVAKDADHARIVDTADPVTDAVWDAARRCHVALGCRDYGLFDFRIDDSGRPFFLEAGLYCSFAKQSVVSVMAAAVGIPLRTLFADCVAVALERGPSS